MSTSEPRPPAPTPPPAASPVDEKLPDRLPKEDQPSTWQPLLYARLAVLGLAIAYLIAFVVQNTDEIRIDFIFSSAKVHLIWALLLCVAIGVVGGVLLSQLYRHRGRAKLLQRSRK